jgi:hypothetical protein
MTPDTPPTSRTPLDDITDDALNDLSDKEQEKCIDAGLRFLCGETLASIASTLGTDASVIERRVGTLFRAVQRRDSQTEADLTAEVERMRAIIDHLRDGKFGEAAMVNIATREESADADDLESLAGAPPKITLHRLIVSAPTLSEELICELLQPEIVALAAALHTPLEGMEPIGTGTDPEKAAEAKAKTRRRALAFALRTVREALGLSVGAAHEACGFSADELACRESGDHAMSPFVLRHHIGALTGFVNQLAATRQDLDGALHRLKRANEQKAEADARYFELLHALLEQQGGSAVVFDLTPEARAAHVGRSIVETRLGGMGATKYVLAPRDPAVTTEGR